MYLGTDDSYTYTDRHGTQHHTQGDFLLLVTPEEDGFDIEKMRALIRQVSLDQVGHYMMGTARIGGDSYTVSGTYGNMGLTMDIKREAWEEYAVPLPEELREH